MRKLEIKVGAGGLKYLAYETPSPVGGAMVPMTMQEQNCTAIGAWPLIMEAVEARDRCEHEHGGLVGELNTAHLLIERHLAQGLELQARVEAMTKDAEAREADAKEVRQQVASLSAQLDSANDEIATLKAPAAEQKSPTKARR